MTTRTTRPYQTRIIRETRKFFAAGIRRVLIQLPTGAGKTHIALELVRLAGARRVLYVVPSDEIYEQTEADLRKARTACAGLKAGGFPDMNGKSALIAMAQTLVKRIDTDVFASWRPELIFIDEAHKLFDLNKTLLERWGNVSAIGLSATPCRLDDKPLHELFPHMVVGESIPRLIADQWLVAARTYQAPVPDLSAVGMRGGDFDPRQLEQAYSTKKVLTSIPEYWLRHAKGRRTIVFTTGIDASKALVDVFRSRGAKAVHIDGNSSRVVRKRALARLKAGEIDILCNCALLIEGLDITNIGAIVLATSTLSLSRFLQMVGRGLRPHAGKRDLVIIDHGGNSYRHGKVDTERDWLQGGRPLDLSLKTCVSCNAIIAVWRDICPACYRLPTKEKRKGSLTRRRDERERSRRTGVRECPPQYRHMRDVWDAAETERLHALLPLSYPASRCHKALKRRRAQS